jgi:hypothetical protein
MVDFKSMKRNSGKDNLAALAEKSAGKKEYVRDARYYTPKADEKGNGTVVLRFLPPAHADGEKGTEYVEIWKHSFKNETNGRYYIENSLTTLKGTDGRGLPDPVSEMNSELWKTGLESDKELARKRKRNHKYISNVLIIKDDLQPDMVGGVYLYEYGQKIFEKITAKISPEFEDVAAFDPFSMDEGANFRLKFKIDVKSKQRTYDPSEFDQPTALFGGDETKQENLWKLEHSLLAEIAEDKFKSYDSLAKQLAFVLDTAAPAKKKAEDEEVAPQERKQEPKETPKEKDEPTKEKSASSKFFDADEDDIPW